MIEYALRLALTASSRDTAPQIVPMLAPSTRDQKGDDAWERWAAIDEAATKAVFLLFREPDDRLEIGFAPLPELDPTYPDQALVSRVDRQNLRFRSRGEPLRGAFLPENYDRRALLIELVNIHQFYRGAVTDAWTIADWAFGRSKYPRGFARDLVRGLDYAERDGEGRHADGDSRAGPSAMNPKNPASVGYALRMLSEFYERCTDTNARRRAPRLLLDLMRLRFSRTLTAIETLWDVLLDEAERSPWLSRQRDPAPANNASIWEYTKRGWRLAEHDLSAPQLVGFLGLEGPIRHYERGSAFLRRLRA